MIPACSFNAQKLMVVCFKIYKVRPMALCAKLITQPHERSSTAEQRFPHHTPTPQFVPVSQCVYAAHTYPHAEI
jgi:hypothetical protein